MEGKDYNKYSAYFIEYTGDISKDLEKCDYAFLQDIFPMAAMIYVEKGKEERLIQEMPRILSIEENSLFNTVVLEEEYTLQPPKKLIHHNRFNGKDLIIGIAGPGLDFLQPLYLDEEGKSRVVGILDEGVDLEDIYSTYGRAYSSSKVNRAIAFKERGANPYDIVPYMGDSSYIDNISSVIGDREFGMVPNCKFAFVKLRGIRNKSLKNGMKEDVYDTYGILKALDYLYKVKVREDKPMVVYLPLEGRTAVKDGSSIVEKSINYYSRTGDFVVVATTGGSGNSSCYYSDFLRTKESVKTEIITFNEENYQSFTLSLGIHYLDQVDIKLKGLNTLEEVEITSQDWRGERKEVILNKGRIEALFLPPRHRSFMKEAKIKFCDVVEKYWQVQVIGEDITFGEFNLSLHKGLYNTPIFVSPKGENTLSIPAMAKEAVIVTCYSKEEGGIRGLSGKLNKDNIYIPRPIIIDGTGVSIESGNEYIKVKGIALSGAIATAIIAMILQWAVIENNKRNLSISDIRAILIEASREVGSARRLGDFGVFDLYKFLEKIL